MRIVELRIHGVSGTPPEDMLTTDIDHPLTSSDIEQVAGDTQVGFHQRKQTPWPQDPDRVLEAYHWGQLTSGSWTKSLWLILVPFGMVNMAHFMLPDGVQGWRRPFRVGAEATLRALGVVMSLALTLGAAEAAVDQVAWQWTGLPAGGDTFARAPDPRGWLVGGLAVSALIPLLILWFAGAKAPGAGQPVAPIAVPRAKRQGFLRDEFDVGDPDIPTLRNLHLATVWAVLGLLGFWLPNSAGAQWRGPSGVGEWTCAAVAGLALVVAILLGNPHHRTGASRRRTFRWLGVILLVAGLTGLLAGIIAVAAATGLPHGVDRTCTAQLVAAADPLAAPPDLSVCGRGVLPGINMLMAAVLAVGVLALILLTIATVVLASKGWRADTSPPFHRYLGGMTSPVLAGVGAFLGIGYGAAIVFATQHLLATITAKGFNPVLPPLVQRVAHAWAITAIEVVVIVTVVLILKRLQRNRFEAAVTAAHNVDRYRWATPPVAVSDKPTNRGGLGCADDLTPAEVRTVASAWWTARVKMHVQWIFVIIAVVGFALSAAIGVALYFDLHGHDPGRCVDTTGPSSVRWLGAVVSCSTYGGAALVALGSLVLLGLGTGLIYVGRRSVADVGIRRGANVFWDIVAFWPRTAHPLVPPPYTALGIDQLRRRVYFWLGLCACPERHRDSGCTCAKAAQPVEKVVLAAHSQGSLLAVAALLGLRIAGHPWGEPVPAVDAPPEFAPIRPDQLAVLTFGSQLQVAYARGFPHYVNQDLLAKLLGLIPWIGLLRETDPIGGQVLSANRTPLYHGPGATGPRPSSWRLDTATWQPDVFVADGIRRCGNEWRLLDPTPADGENAPRRAMLQHGGYFLDPAWEVAIAQLRG